MEKEKYYIYPSIIWVIFKLTAALCVIGYIIYGPPDNNIVEIHSMRGLFIIVMLVNLYREVKMSSVQRDEITVFYIIGRRRIKKERIKVIQFVKQRESYHMLIILDDHKIFEDDLSRRRWKLVENFAVYSPVKVVHMHIPGKKREQISSSLKNLGYKVVFMDCDAMRRMQE